MCGWWNDTCGNFDIFEIQLALLIVVIYS